MVARTKQQLKDQVAASITTNGQGQITGAILRTVMNDFIDSMLADLDGTIQISDVQSLQQTLDALTGAQGSGAALQLKNGTTVRAEATATGLRLDIPTYSDNAAARNGGLQTGEVYMDSSGILRRVLAAVSNPLPNSVLVSQYDPTVEKAEPIGNIYLAYFGRRWRHYSAAQPWSVTSTDDIWLRFETRSTDLYTSPSWTDPTGTNRNRMDGETDLAGNTIYLCEGRFRIEPPTITARWFQLIEFHTYQAGGAATATANMCQLRIVGNKFQVEAPFSNPSSSSGERILWESPGNVAYNKEYRWKFYVKPSVAGGNGRIIFELDGERVLDFTGYVGHSNQGLSSFQFGTYRGGFGSAWVPETTVVHHKIESIQTGAIAEPPPPNQNPDTFGPNLFTAGNNGTMDNTTGFNPPNGATIASVSGELEVTRLNPTGNAYVGDLFPVTTGRIYQVDLEMRRQADSTDANMAAGVVIYWNGRASGDPNGAAPAVNLQWAESVSTTKEAFSFRFTAPQFEANATTGDLTIFFHSYSAAAGDKAYFDNVTIREVNPGT